MSVRPTAGSAVCILLAACGVPSEPEVPPLTIHGTVLIGGAPAEKGRAQVFLLGGDLLGAALTDADGSYEIEAASSADACAASVRAFLWEDRFPVESSPVRVLVGRPLSCEGVVAVHDFELPAVPVELVPVGVSGVVTQGGEPASATLILYVHSMLAGLLNVDTTSTSADGSYRLEGEVPAYYCDQLGILSTPLTGQAEFVIGCDESRKDLELAG